MSVSRAVLADVRYLPSHRHSTSLHALTPALIDIDLDRDLHVEGDSGTRRNEAYILRGGETPPRVLKI